MGLLYEMVMNKSEINVLLLHEENRNAEHKAAAVRTYKVKVIQEPAHADNNDQLARSTFAVE